MASDEPSVPARRRLRPPSGGPAAIAIVLVVIALVVGAAIRAGRPAPPSARPSGPAVVLPSEATGPAAERGYLVTLAELRTRAAAAAGGAQPEAAALADLLGWAAGAVDGAPHPVEPLRIDGTTGPFVDDSATAYGLALAWGATGDRRYADASRAFILAWARTTRSLVGACPSDGDCQTSLIVSRTAPGFVFAADLLTASGVLTPADDETFAAWLRTVILPAASERTNNWGDAGVFLRLVATDDLGDAAGFGAALDAWRAQLDLVAPDGHIPEEVRRGSSGLSYTQEALLYKVAAARIAERRGIDLWDYRGAGGGTLRSALDYAAHYELDPAGWAWARNVDVPAPGPVWELAYAKWPEPDFAALLESARPIGFPGHSAIRWTTLTNGIPIGG